MDDNDRRRLLQALGLGLGGGLAGCLSDGPGGTTDDGERPGTTDGSTGSPTGTPTPDGGVAYEVTSLGTGVRRPAWHAEEKRGGYAELYASAAAARTRLGLDELDDDRREAADSVIDTTEFERERLLFVTSIGPDTCHNRVEVPSMGIADGRLVGAARAVDTRGPDEGCGDAVTFPSALVRITFEGEPSNSAVVTVTDGWGEQTQTEATAIERDPGSLPGHVRPSRDPQNVPAALECDDADFNRHGTGFSGRPGWGLSAADWGAFALRVDAREVARGDTVTVTLTNVGAAEGHTGNRHKYNLQVWTEAGWQDVRGTVDGDMIAYTDEGIVHQPGEGFQWTFEMTEAGVVADHPQVDRLTVCPGLPAGRYRFAFWEPAVAVAFDLSD